MNDLVTTLTESVLHYEDAIKRLGETSSVMKQVADLAIEQQADIEVDMIWVSGDTVLIETDRKNMLKLANLLDVQFEAYGREVNVQGEATFKYRSNGDLPILVWTGPPPNCVITQVGEQAMPVWEVECNG